ncbi:MAG: hypothetical protein ABIZ91_19130 [Gemmatimonadaceae bacterium]
MTKHFVLRTAAIGLISIVTAIPAQAQGPRPLSLWVGVGRQVARDSVSFDLNNLDAYGALQLDMPLFPVALRADINFAGSDFQRGRRNVIASAVLPLRLPVIQPYAMLGYGIYDWGKANEERGISYGGGVRLQLGAFGIFAQARRHDSLKQSIGTVGVVF